MELGDIPMAMGVINQEGWGYTPPEIERMLKLEPDGSFLYESEEPVGAITTIAHGPIGVIGHLVVSRKSRGRGIGGALLKHAVDHLRSRGTESVIVIATDEGRPLYSKHGFRVEREILCKHLMLDSSTAPERPARPEPMLKSDLKEVCAIDGRLFGANRSRLIVSLYDESPEACFKLSGKDGIDGFCMGRRTETGFDLGPWVCLSGSSGNADELFRATLSICGQGKVFCGMFAENGSAVEISGGYPLFMMWSTKLMVLGRSLCYPRIDQLFGIAAFELG